MCGSAAIRVLFSSMLSTVELDDEAMLHAREIREVRADRMLPSESVPGQTPVANLEPQPKLRVGHGRSQRTCAIASPHTPMLGRMRTSCDQPEGCVMCRSPLTLALSRHLLAVLGDLVAAYEAREVAMPEVEPREVLRLLMEANALSQADLAEELGGQSVASS
jgi:hypothetical protein